MMLPALGVYAQDTFEAIADYLRVVGEANDGDIMSLDADGYQVADTTYDDRVFGVINDTPAVGLSIVSGENKKPIVSSGMVSVNVSTINGAIEAGDFITTSDKPGVGMRANDPGMVIGIALEGYDPGDEELVGQVLMAMDKHFAINPTDEKLTIPRSIGSQFRNALVTGAVAAVTDPNTTLRYIIAGIVMIISLLFGLIVFGRLATSGVVAIGRNPMARRYIFLAIAFNVFMTIAITAGGVVVAFFILAL